MHKPPFLSVGRTKINIQRYGKGSWVDGRYVEATPTNVCIEGMIQPGLKFTDIQHLPEGERGRKGLRVWSHCPIYQVEEGDTGRLGDFITFEGYRWRVVNCIHYSVGPLQHYKAIAVREELT